MPLLLELKLAALAALLIGALLGWQHFVSAEQAQGYAKRAAEDAATTVRLQAQFDAETSAWQALYDNQGEAYEQKLQEVSRASAARSVVVGRVRNNLAAVGQRADQLSKTPGDTCRSQDEQIARGAELLGRCGQLLDRAAELAGALDAQVTGLQGLSK